MTETRGNILATIGGHESNYQRSDVTVLRIDTLNDSRFVFSTNDEKKLRNVSVPLPNHERERVLLLRQCSLLDSEQDEAFDRFTNLAARCFEVLTLLFIGAAVRGDNFSLYRRHMPSSL